MMPEGKNKKNIDPLLEGRSLGFVDECHFYQHETRIRAWYPPENTDLKVLQE